LTAAINSETRPEELLELALGEIDFEVLAERPVAFECTCSFEKALAMVGALGREEVESMIAENHGAEMNCGFCNEVYKLNEDDLDKILTTI
jgi:molecular chaperone Hsp33